MLAAIVTVSSALTALFFLQAEDGIRDKLVTGVQTCALPIYATDETDDKGEPIKGDTMLLLVNASEAQIDFALPNDGGWSALIDTSREPLQPTNRYPLSGNSLVLLRLTP